MSRVIEGDRIVMEVMWELDDNDIPTGRRMMGYGRWEYRDGHWCKVIKELGPMEYPAWRWGNEFNAT